MVDSAPPPFYRVLQCRAACLFCTVPGRTTCPSVTWLAGADAFFSQGEMLMVAAPSFFHVFFHLFLLYISWGSTYVAIKWCLAALGPFLLVGCRMLVAGGLLALFLLATGRWKRPSRGDCLHAVWLAVFMVLMGSGFLAKGQQLGVSACAAALITGSTPFSMLLAGWLFAGERRPCLMQWLGLVGSFAGLVMLEMGQEAARMELGGPLAPGEGGLPLAGMCWILFATWGWVAGSLLSRRFPHTSPLSGLQSCSLLLLVGGLECVVAGLLWGEASLTHWELLQARSVLAFLWMSIGGGIFAYYCYFWLLERVSIAVAVSYEYVVPVVGVLLGWQLAGEPVNAMMAGACALIVLSVFFVMWHKNVRA